MNTRSKTEILSVLAGLALVTAPGHAQINGPLPILWQATYGPGLINGAGGAIPYDFVQTPDGGFLIAGEVNGKSNDIFTQSICQGDFCVIKIDAQGQRQWDRVCGGNVTWAPGDLAFRVFSTPDGGFMLAGGSAAKPGCCKTAPLLGDTVNPWVVRFDANADKLWDQSYLPDGLDLCWGFDFERTADGGYLACGQGGIGQNNAYWGIIKLDAQGQKLWTKKIGCLSTTAVAEALRIRETADGGFIVAGHSSAPPCADKTSLYYGGYDPNNPWLGSDFWVVRFDAQQNILWDKSYGGTSTDLALDIQPAADGGFLVVGTSQSPAVTDPKKGTKSSPRFGGCDFWIVRIDAQGNQLWDRSYGGSLDDFCTHAEPMPDGGWLLSGTSLSLPSGNKTSPRFGGYDFWLVRIDDQGNQLWDQSFGGTRQEGKDWRTFGPPQFMRETLKHTADGGFLLTGFSMSPVSGTKTAPLISQGDFWVLKLGPEPPSLQASFTPEGQCKFRLIGPPQFAHAIQGSDDLSTWKELVTHPPTEAGKTDWVDPEKGTLRFYRALRK